MYKYADRFAIEQRELPEDPRNLTYRGRYRHVDQRLVELCGLVVSRKKARIRVLDVGCGILSFGSPTMHDLYDAINMASAEPDMVGVDRNLPPELAPAYSDIRYQAELPRHGSFDVLRVLRVWEHMELEAYWELRRQALGLLREGGYFVATQSLGRWKLDKLSGQFYVVSLGGTVIKISQKRDDQLVPVAFLPDVFVPWSSGIIWQPDAERLKTYQTFRARVLSGEQDISFEMDTERLRNFMGQLGGYSPRVLDEESHEAQAKRDLLGSGSWKDPEGSVRRAASDAPAYFLSQR